MDKFVDERSKKHKAISPVHLVALVDLGLFALLSIRTGVFESIIMILGATKIVLTYTMYLI